MYLWRVFRTIPEYLPAQSIVESLSMIIQIDMHKNTNKIVSLILISLIVLLSGCTNTFSTDVDSSQKISATSGNFDNNLDDGDQFGQSIANIGDVERDGVIDLAVGAPGDDDNAADQGAVSILFMDDNGQVDVRQKISESEGNFTGILDSGDRFGAAVTGLGDLNRDGFTDLAVGAPGDDDGGTDRGAVWILNLDAQGRVFSQQKISNDSGDFNQTLDDSDEFGTAVTSIGDVNRDGIVDLAVGVPGDDDGGTDRGAVWILFMNNNGTVFAQQKISFNIGGFSGNLENGDHFGTAIANMGDLDGDGVNDLAVGTPGANDGGIDRGAVWILFLNSNGTVKNQIKIAQNNAQFTGPLADGDRFGSAVTSLGDLNNDGISDLGVGANLNDDGGAERGAVWVLFMRKDTTVISASRISDTQGNFQGVLNDSDQFGTALASLGDLNRDGVPDIASGANLDNDGGTDRGAVWVLFMRAAEVKVDTDYDADLATIFSGRGY